MRRWWILAPCGLMTLALACGEPADPRRVPGDDLRDGVREAPDADGEALDRRPPGAEGERLDRPELPTTRVAAAARGCA